MSTSNRLSSFFAISQSGRRIRLLLNILLILALLCGHYTILWLALGNGSIKGSLRSASYLYVEHMGVIEKVFSSVRCKETKGYITGRLG